MFNNIYIDLHLDVFTIVAQCPGTLKYYFFSMDGGVSLDPPRDMHANGRTLHTYKINPGYTLLSVYYKH